MNQDIIRPSVGKVISSVVVDGNVLTLRFQDGSGLSFADEGQCCCESRYMSVDGDDLSEFVGATFNGAEIKDYAGPEIEESYDVHEVEWLCANTSRGDITVSNHNEHNGYYGGFSVQVSAF